MSKSAAAIASLALLLPGGAQAGEDFFQYWDELYRQRVEGVTASAGNAKDVNAAVHVIDPWPPYVANRRIPGNGARMVGAIERYKDVKRLPEAAPTLEPVITEKSGTQQR